MWIFSSVCNALSNYVAETESTAFTEKDVCLVFQLVLTMILCIPLFSWTASMIQIWNNYVLSRKFQQQNQFIHSMTIKSFSEEQITSKQLIFKQFTSSNDSNCQQTEIIIRKVTGYKLKDNKMDSFQNPEQFENSSIVQKSSKTGIFSNKRLLVIKSGYLYYFSKVPKGYKSHVPNILTTFTDLPKSSIQIKNILQIRLQSTKSSNLIIKFYLKDMIDREDIRKSIDSHSYMLPNKKVNSEIDQWKFMFTTVLQCRLWFNALIKLKDYFKNLEHKFKDFVANFDNKKTSGNHGKDNRSQSDLKISLGSINSSEDKLSAKNAKPDQGRKTEPINFDALKFIGSVPQKQPSPRSPNLQQSPKSQNSKINQVQQSKVQKIISNNTISEESQNSQNGYHPNISHKIQPQIPQPYSQNIKKVEFFKSTLKQSHYIEPINEEDQIKIKQLEDQIREEVKQQVEKQVRDEVESEMKQKIQRQKKEEMKKFRAEVELKEMKIKQLQTEIHIKHLANMEKQKQIEKEKKQLQNKILEEQEKLQHYKFTVEKQNQEQNKLKNIQKQSLSSKQNQNKHQGKQGLNFLQNLHQNSNKKWFEVEDENEGSSSPENQDGSIHKEQKDDQTKPSIMHQQPIQVHQFSVQTDEEQHPVIYSDSFEPHFNFSKEISLSKQLNFSKQSKIRNSFFTDDLTSNRNTLLSERFRIDEDLLPSINQNQKEEFFKFNYFSELSRIFENGISSNERIQREIKLQRYVNFVKNQVILIAQEFIDKNRPSHCIKFEKGMFSFELACAQGKVMNIGGESKLIYSNKVHQNLKRAFKIYQHLQEEILKIMKNKPNFPVRVPLCTLVEYKGYTVLGKVEICSQQQDFAGKDKYLKHLLPSAFYSSIQLSKTIQTEENTEFYMIKALTPFKVTNEQKSSQIFKCQDNFYLCLTQVIKSRKSGVSICYQKLKKEYQQCEKQKKQMDTDGDIKQVCQNELWVLTLFKLMRELKKLFKSMQPYSLLQSQKINVRSQFVQALIKNPQQLLALIPSDFDLTTVEIQCGYFWFLLEFFLGIRINNPVNKNTPSPSYQFVPVVQTFYFPALLSNQYCQKVDKYLALNNMESLQNCYKFLKKISSKQVEAPLVEIKILLKKKQYAIAQKKIYALRESLNLHDLVNIEINAYLIQCYVFMGLETEALQEIKSSLEYVEYMFGNRKNVFEQNLHLLMAETLLKMGNITESIKLYRSLLKHGKIAREQILISFGETLVCDHRFDPNETIPFLLQCVQELKSSGNRVELLVCLAKLYLRSQRRDKCIFYLQKAYELSLSSKVNEHLLNIYQMLMNESRQIDSKHKLYQHLLQKAGGKLFQIQQNCRNFNTINLYHLIVSHQRKEQENITQFLHEVTQQLKKSNSMFSVQLKDWQQLKSLANILSGTGQNDLEFLGKNLFSINVEKLLNQLKVSK